MTHYLLLLTFLLGAPYDSKQVSENVMTQNHTEVSTNTLEQDTQPIMIGDSIIGDFDGNGKLEAATLHIIKEGEFQEKPWIFSIDFSDKNIPSILFECDRDYSTLINEGNLGRIGGDKLSVYSPPLGGCTYTMKTYSFSKNKWNIIVPLFLVPTACEDLTDNELQERIFSENGSIFYYEVDPNTSKLIKTEVDH